MTTIRQRVILDTVAKVVVLPEVSRFYVASDDHKLLSEAKMLGAEVLYSPASTYEFGAKLKEIVHDNHLERVLYLGGGALPLADENLFHWIFEALQSDDVVILNNPQSPDAVGFTPAQCLLQAPILNSDNELAMVLRDLGLQKMLMPNTAEVNFDLDTPIDYALLVQHPNLGPRAKQALETISWNTPWLERAVQLLATEGTEVLLTGRVGPTVITFLNANLKVRVRAYSEERGMKALDRERQGKVKTLLGFLYKDLGPRRFVAEMSSLADLWFWDTRPFFAHMGWGLSTEDRFAADLLDVSGIEHTALRELIEEIKLASIPIILGGHAMVSGGLWLLAEQAIRQKK